MATNNITERAMLVHLKISKWNPNKKDQQVSGEVTTQKGADVDAGSWTTRLVAKEYMHHIGAATSQLKTAHDIVTLPWLEGGLRILPAAMLMRYTEGMRKARMNFDAAVEDFVQWYDSYRQSPLARNRLGSLFCDLPTTDEVRSKFNIQHDILPMPDTNDFRIALGEDEVKRLKTKMARSIETLTRNATQSLWKQMDRLVKNIQTKLTTKNSGEDGEEKDAVFRDSLINNLRDFCEAVPALNITEDADIEVMRQQCIDTLAGIKPETLRTDATARNKAAQSAEDIIAQLQGYKL